jgi:CYTH domain-containing protein
VTLGVEIERKYLVRDLSVVDGLAGERMTQGYLSIDPRRTVRVRTSGSRAFLTVKGITSESGASRPEFEYEIPGQDGTEMLGGLAVGPLIDKTRYRVPANGLVWEIDVFAGDNAGLVVAEIELPSETTAVDLPWWIGDEVTGDARYLNVNLVGYPYKMWDKG